MLDPEPSVISKLLPEAEIFRLRIDPGVGGPQTTLCKCAGGELGDAVPMRSFAAYAEHPLYGICPDKDLQRKSSVAGPRAV